MSLHSALYALTLLLPMTVIAGFGLQDRDGQFTIDSGAGLVIKVDKDNGNIVSLRYKGGPELQAPKGSHIASGYGGATVSGEVIDGSIAKITIATPESNTVMKSLTQYLLVKRGNNVIYMATYATHEPGVGELRWITRLNDNEFPDSPAPSDLRGNKGAIESKDVFGMPDGTTRSKYYGDTKTHGKDRAIDMTYCGVGGPRVGVWMVYWTRESSSGGPFFRDIQNQTAEVYNYMNSGHNMAEPPRLNVLHGPYALVFTDGKPPRNAPDFTWIDKTPLGLHGYVPISQRGIVTGAAKGVEPGLAAVVGFSNSSAQYWARVAPDGTYRTLLMKPGTYDATLYQGELAVGSGKVTVTARTNATCNLTATPMPAAVFRIGNWDGAPNEFLNGDKIVTMHPSDARMAPWKPVTFTVGKDSASTFPALQLRSTNSPTTIRFTLTPQQVAPHTLRIGITCAYNGGRPAISVNSWQPKRPPSPSNQPRSRSFTIGTYRGNNTTFTYDIPASAFHPGENTLTISPLSGTKDLGQWLTAGWAYDAIQLDAAK